MPTPIKSEVEYRALMQKIEAMLQSATQNGGFAAMPEHERRTLQQLSYAAESWEDSQQMMPIPFNQHSKQIDSYIKQVDLAKMLKISPARLWGIIDDTRRFNSIIVRQLPQFSSNLTIIYKRQIRFSTAHRKQSKTVARSKNKHTPINT